MVIDLKFWRHKTGTTTVYTWQTNACSWIHWYLLTYIWSRRLEYLSRAELRAGAWSSPPRPWGSTAPRTAGTPWRESAVARTRGRRWASRAPPPGAQCKPRSDLPEASNSHTHTPRIRSNIVFYLKIVKMLTFISLDPSDADPQPVRLHLMLNINPVLIY